MKRILSVTEKYTSCSQTFENGYSIGNPTFSKNSSNILAFDYWNNEEEIFDVLGVNIEENTVGLIAENNMVGWPSFNKTDNQLAFTTWGG